MNELQEDLPGRVRTERKNRGWTQQDMADRANMSLRAYQGFESRKSSPQGANLRAILRAVGMSADQEDIAEATREEWPRDIKVFLDMMGAYLDTMEPDVRLEVMHTITRQVFESR